MIRDCKILKMNFGALKYWNTCIGTYVMHKFISMKYIKIYNFKRIMQVFIIVVKFIEYMTFSNQKLNIDFSKNYLSNKLTFH